MRGCIRRRGKDSWELRWYIGRGPDGRKRYRTKTVRSSRKSDAQTELNRILGEMANGDYVSPAHMTLSVLADRCLRDLKPQMELSTWTWYEIHLRLYVKPALGHITLAKLTPLDIQSFYTDLAEDDDIGHATARAAHRALHRVLRQAVKWRLLSYNPITSVDAPPARNKLRPNPLSAEEVQQFLEAARTLSRSELYLTAIMTGMRQGELLALRWEDIDFARNTIRITGSLSRDRRRKRTKTATSIRSISIPSRLAKTLEQLPRISEYVWCTASSRPLSARNLQRQFHLILEKAKLESRRFHDLRHTHATLLLLAGVHPKVVQERLGHRDIKTTMNLYSHVLPNMQEEAVTKLDSVLAPEYSPKLTASEQLF